MVSGQEKFSVKSLKTLALDAVVAPLREWEERSGEPSKEEFVMLAKDFARCCPLTKPIVHLVLERGSFQSSDKICVLFSALLVQEQRVEVCGQHRTRMVDLITDSELCDSDTLARVSELSLEVGFSANRDRFFSKFPNLQKFRIKQGLTVGILESLARLFPKLSVFDGSRDSCCWVTDVSLRCMTSLNKLKYVLFYPAIYSDNYLECPKPLQPGYTGMGMAFLLSKLPELVKITGPNTVMNEALHFLEFTNFQLLTVKSLDLNNLDLRSNVLRSASNVCPNLERLAVYVHDSDVDVVNQQLQRFSRIKELNFELDEDFFGIPFEFGDVGRQLVVLHLENLSFERAELVTLSDQCPNVKFLSVVGQCLDDSATLDDCLRPTWPLLFPRLEILALSWGGPCSLYSFMHKQSNLVKVAIFGATEDTIALKSLRFDHGIWPKVETLSIRIKEEADDAGYRRVHDEGLTLHLVEVLPSLKLISVSIAKEEEGVSMISSRGNAVMLCSDNSFQLYSNDPEFDRLDCFELDNV